MEEYLNFVRYCIDEQQCVPTIKSWNALFLFMQQQALLGVGFRGLERMKAAGVDVPRDVVLKWYAISEQIRRRNVEMNKMCVELTEMLKKDGFESCILKGQGNSLMYPNPYTRMSGDVDMLVDGGRKKVVRYIKGMFPYTKTAYQHIDFPIFQDVDVEVHFVPIAMNNPWYNRRIQHWMGERMGEQCQHFVDLPDGVGKIAVPTTEFNIVYQMSHLMHHFFDEGIGLRQMMDYYYLLRKADNGLGFRVESLGYVMVIGYRLWVIEFGASPDPVLRELGRGMSHL